jgi:excinuclease ABC subunit A
LTRIEDLDPKENILIKGAKLHNLKNIDVVIPRNQLVVITGLSGSGKSSLAFDTLYAEGQRRYVESLSSYARQFLGRLDKPKVDYIKGISPAIAIEQKVNSTNPRSTVGTSTEIYDYLKLLFARIGKTYSPISNNEVKKHQVSDVIDFIKNLEEGEKLLLLAPVKLSNRSFKEQLNILQQQGFSRIFLEEKVLRIDQVDDSLKVKEFAIVVDRIVVKKDDEDFYNRLADAVDNAFFEGKGHLLLRQLSTEVNHDFSNKFELDGMSFLEPNVHLFSFNNPYGACSTCEGYGDVIGIDETLVVPDTSLSLYEEAVFPWRGEKMKWYLEQLVAVADRYDFPIHKPYYQLTEAQKEFLWEGQRGFVGIYKFFEEIEAKAYKIQNRVMLSRYRGKSKCKTCKGTRLRKEASYVKIEGHAISELVELPIAKLKPLFENLQLDSHNQKIAERLLKEINNRLEFLSRVGLDYLTLNRKSNTLSGGESQRINLATSLGSSLVGSMYILDEPSIGLHSKDNERLINVLKHLRDLGNTVIVVEHDEEIMRQADKIIDIGPEAGTHGGHLVAEGSFNQILEFDTLTANYLSGKMQIEVPKKRRTSTRFLEIKGARANNLKNIDIQVPLGILTCLTGVSGSGKSTLVKEYIYPILQKHTGGYGNKIGALSAYGGKYQHIEAVEYVDQNPIGKSSRSNPVTYIKAYDDIRNLYAQQKLSKIRNFQAKHFSFNVDGGRCDNCQGEGEVTIEMQFMADVHLECDVCEGKRFKKEVLEVNFEDASIFDVLSMTIDDAISFFKKHQQEKIAKKLQPLQDVGLGYVQLGQSSSTLSGGEAQRIKLASFLTKGSRAQNTAFIFDEPTTGLHFHDINKLLQSFNALIENGHSVIVIEHNLDLMKCADYIIDIGAGGGENGGTIVAKGTPEEVAKNKASFTGSFLKSKL